MRCLPRVAVAQAYPTRLVRILVGVAAGGSTDIVAGVIGQWLSERLGQQFVVDNRPGVGTNIATEQVVKAAPDGYTLLMVAASMRALVCERRSVLEYQSLLLTPRTLGRSDEVLDRERAWPAVGDKSLQNNR